MESTSKVSCTIRMPCYQVVIKAQVPPLYKLMMKPLQEIEQVTVMSPTQDSA